MHYILLQIIEQEEGGIARTYFTQFRGNLRDSTLPWLAVLICGILLYVDFRVFRADADKRYLVIPAYIAAAVLAIILVVELIVGIWLLGRDEKTDITDFRAAPGRDQHSITLYVEYTGDTPDDWMITFLSPDGISRTVTFQGESISIQGLNPGAEYTFFLSSSDGRTLTGLTQISYFLPEARG
jgi:hypothetical protein